MTMRAAAPSSSRRSQRQELDAQLCFKVYAVNNLLGRLYRPLLEPLGLTYPQYLAMLASGKSARRRSAALGAG